ncbi:hypothetical protein BX600DRAFT_461251 [Xylariales sp. PMI_506]|nr:hypothetical protein BX600DRAFT_461251 [Xylariales sp. PMI_506]
MNTNSAVGGLHSQADHSLGLLVQSPPALSTTRLTSDKGRRVRTGCITCRARKVKCDENPGGCNNCKKRKLVCDFIDIAAAGTRIGSHEQHGIAGPSPPSVSSTAASSSPASPVNLRVPTACQECRAARARCSHSRPRCTRCVSRAIHCVYPDVRSDDITGLTPTASARIAQAKARSQKRVNLLGGAAQHHKPPKSGQPIAHHHHHHHQAPNDVHGQRDHDQIHPMHGVVQREHLTSSPSSLAEQGRPGNSSTYNHFSHLDQDSELMTGATPQGYSSQLPVNFQQYVDAFFDYVAPYQANSFLHRGTLKQQIRDGQTSEILLLAICAITARFLDHQSLPSTQVLPPSDPTGSTSMPRDYLRNQATHWAQIATQKLSTSAEMTLDNAMAALVLCKNASYSGAFNQAFLLAALANRYALKLRLFDEAKWIDAEETVDMPWVEREQRRRVMFACYCVDRMTATGMKELTFCPAESIRLQLPCEDYNFDLRIPCHTPIPVLESDDLAAGVINSELVGTMGHYVSMVGIRYVISRYTENLTNPAFLPPWHPESEYMLCIRKLAQWSGNLPVRLQLTRENIFGRHQTPHLGPLVMLHLWFDMLHIELYRLALQTHTDPRAQALFLTAPAGWINQTQDLCVYHARNMVKTLRLIEDEIGSNGAGGGGGGGGGGNGSNGGDSYADTGCFVILDPSLAMLCYASMKMQLMYALERNPMLAEGEHVDPELLESFSVLLYFVERLSKYFRPAKFLLREMKHTLQKSGVAGPWSESTVSSSGTQTPDHPWLARLKRMDQPSPTDLTDMYTEMGILSANMLSESGLGFYNQIMDVPGWLS